MYGKAVGIGLQAASLLTVGIVSGFVYTRAVPSESSGNAVRTKVAVQMTKPAAAHYLDPEMLSQPEVEAADGDLKQTEIGPAKPPVLLGPAEWEARLHERRGARRAYRRLDARRQSQALAFWTCVLIQMQSSGHR